MSFSDNEYLKRFVDNHKMKLTELEIQNRINMSVYEARKNIYLYQIQCIEAHLERNAEDN